MKMTAYDWGFVAAMAAVAIIAAIHFWHLPGALKLMLAMIQ